MQKKAYLSIISAAALWGCIGVFLRLLTAAGLDSMESVAVRSTVAAILYFFWLLFTDRGGPPSPSEPRQRGGLPRGRSSTSGPPWLQCPI